MNREKAFAALSELDDLYIAEAIRYRPEEAFGSPERISHMKKRIITLALAAALILALGVTAYAVYDRRLQDLVLNDDRDAEAQDALPPTPPPEGVNEDSPEQPYPVAQDIPDMISLQGFAGSPEFEAAQAWWAFWSAYDTDHALLNQVGNGPTPWDETYGVNGYFVYTQEMADKLEEIAAEHGLTLHGGGMHSATLVQLRERFGPFCTLTDGSGYYFDDGTFQCDSVFYDPFDNNGEYYGFQFRRVMKGTMDTISLNIFDVEQYEQWEFETSSGVTVLLALGPNKALILADLEQSFVEVNILLFGPESTFNRELLEALADCFDFSIL